MAKINMTRKIEVGPLAIYFTNVNTSMKLPGHSHYAEVTLVFATLGPRGFPAFATTYKVIQDKLVELTEKPFRDATNEDVADALFAAFDGWSHDEIDKWKGEFRLDAVRLAVRGVPDRIGHADGFTVYSVARDVLS